MERSLCNIRCNEVVGLFNCCKCRRIDFPGLTVTLSCAITSCFSVRQERFHPVNFTVKTEPAVANLVISLCTVDSIGAAFLPKIVCGFRIVRVGHLAFLQNVLTIRTHLAVENRSMTPYSKQQLLNKYRCFANNSITRKVFCKIKQKKINRSEDSLQK